MLLKGLSAGRDATGRGAACEMALIRLAYAADLPPTDKLVRDLLDSNPPLEGGSKNSSGLERQRTDKNSSGRGPTQGSDPSPKNAPHFSTLPQGEGGVTK